MSDTKRHRWSIVFTSPEDPSWHLVSDGVDYGLNHDCPEAETHPIIGQYRGCAYCGANKPEALWGMYKLATWDR